MATRILCVYFLTKEQSRISQMDININSLTDGCSYPDQVGETHLTETYLKTL